MSSRSSSFNTLKYGIFSKEDIIKRWKENDQRLVQLPLGIKLRWIDALAEKYRIDAYNKEKFDVAIQLIKDFVSCKITEGRLPAETMVLEPLSFSVSMLSTSLYSVSFSVLSFSPIESKLQSDTELLNEVIRNYESE